MDKHNLEIIFEKQVELIKNDEIPVELILDGLYEIQEMILKTIGEEDYSALSFSELVLKIINSYSILMVDFIYNYIKIQKNKNKCRHISIIKV